MPGRTGTSAAATHQSFRFPQSTIGRLEQRAKESGSNKTMLVQRYVEEGLRMDDHPMISFQGSAAGRRAMLAGSRLDVAQVVATVKNSGNSVAEAADYLDLPEAKVQACIRYYAEFKDEIDAWTKIQEEIADREQEAWRRAQAVLA